MPGEARGNLNGMEDCVTELPGESGETNVQISIREEDLCGMQYVDVSRSKYRYFKRAIDVIGSAAALIVLALPFLIIMLAIYIDDPGPVFFRQYRIGRNGVRFRICKFRSMKTNTPKYIATNDLTESSTCITRVGRILRKYSIDELPQLINVLLGDMSLVGPRPLISDECEIHEMRLKYGVYNIRPGITGLAQINGRDSVTPVDKVRYDVEYCQKLCFLMDVGILFMTIPKVLKGYGVNDEKKVSHGV